MLSTNCRFSRHLHIALLAPILFIGVTPALIFAQDSSAHRQAQVRFLEARRLKGEAQRTQNARRLEDAVTALKDSIRLDPQAAEPHVDLGEIYFFFQSRPEQAETEALEAIRLDGSSSSARLLLARIYMTALRFEKEQKPSQIDRAIKAYEEVTLLDPTLVESWAMLAELYRLKNEPEKQVAALEHWTSGHTPTDASFYRWLMNQDLSQDQAYYELSQLYRQLGKTKEALKAGRRAYELDPDSAVYSRNLIAVLRLGSSLDEDLKAYSQLSKTADSTALQIGYGAALVRASRYDEAISRLAPYVGSDPANASATVLLSIAQRRARKRLAAIETLKAGIAAVEPGLKPNLQLDLAETYEELGRNEEAMVQYETVFETFFVRGSANQNTDLLGHVVGRLSRIYRRLGVTSKLQQTFSRARPLIGEKSTVLELLTIENLREDGKRREALELARATLRRFPEDRSIKLTEALILSDMRRFDEATEVLKSKVSGRPESATEDSSIYLLLSSILTQTGKLAEAETTIRKSIELNPGDVSLTIQLASVLEKAGRHDEAEKTLRAIIAGEPDNATALNNLGYFLIERGRQSPEALELIERAISIEPINGSFLDSLGWAHYKLGRIKEAREQLERAAVYSRQNSTLHEHLGDVLKELGRSQEARRHWEKALEYSVEAGEIARIKDKLKESQ
jgi:tetratricopeptide (TPR) repeat protein